jgi:hypothetical protein
MSTLFKSGNPALAGPRSESDTVICIDHRSVYA